ncbi:MAG: tetratricopeptide repeat protein, partial [Treponema sp.]|nr:tetratricopeptide repeat protein [Treponema sp.]
MPDKRQNKLIFLSVPESLRGHIDTMAPGDFCINPDIPIPVEIPEGEENLNLEGLSWEMIVSGMLLVITQGREKPEWIDYYRHFVLAVRPEIMAEFTEAAIMKARNGDFDLALEILDALRGLFPSSPSALLNRALVMEERASALERRNREAVAAFEAADAAYAEALALRPPFPDALFNAGFFYLGRKDFRRAKDCYTRFNSISEDREKTERAQSIIKDIDQNGLEDESFSDAYACIMQGDEEAGMRNIRDFIERYPSVWNGWFILGWALRRLRRWEDGAAAFAKAIELGGGGSDTRNELAICLMESGDQKGARHELETAL